MKPTDEPLQPIPDASDLKSENDSQMHRKNLGTTDLLIDFLKSFLTDAGVVKSKAGVQVKVQNKKLKTF
jgi:hypothetical protein